MNADNARKTSDEHNNDRQTCTHCKHVCHCQFWHFSPLQFSLSITAVGTHEQNIFSQPNFTDSLQIIYIFWTESLKFSHCLFSICIKPHHSQ